MVLDLNWRCPNSRTPNSQRIPAGISRSRGILSLWAFVKRYLTPPPALSIIQSFHFFFFSLTLSLIPHSEKKAGTPQGPESKAAVTTVTKDAQGCWCTSAVMRLRGTALRCMYLYLPSLILQVQRDEQRKTKATSRILSILKGKKREERREKREERGET